MGLGAGYDDLPIGARILIRLVMAASAVAAGAGIVYAFRAATWLGALAAVAAIALGAAWDYFFTWLAARRTNVAPPGVFDLAARQQLRHYD